MNNATYFFYIFVVPTLSAAFGFKISSSANLYKGSTVCWAKAASKDNDQVIIVKFIVTNKPAYGTPQGFCGGNIHEGEVGINPI